MSRPSSGSPPMPSTSSSSLTNDVPKPAAREQPSTRPPYTPTLGGQAPHSHQFPRTRKMFDKGPEQVQVTFLSYVGGATAEFTARKLIKIKWENCQDGILHDILKLYSLYSLLSFLFVYIACFFYYWGLIPGNKSSSGIFCCFLKTQCSHVASKHNFDLKPAAYWFKVLQVWVCLDHLTVLVDRLVRMVTSRADTGTTSAPPSRLACATGVPSILLSLSWR